MSEYTKEQEAKALERVTKYINPSNPGRWLDDEDIGIVLAMAKRTAEAETKLEASRIGNEHWHAVALESQQERDALKARVAELEAAAALVEESVGTPVGADLHIVRSDELAAKLRAKKVGA